MTTVSTYLLAKHGEDHGDQDHQRDDEAQAGFVARRQHVNAGTRAFESLARIGHALGCLQEQAHGQSDRPRPRRPARPTGRLHVEAVAIEHDADDRPEHDQRQQPGKTIASTRLFLISMVFLVVEDIAYTFATRGRPSRP
jgi:hypothetical protein